MFWASIFYLPSLSSSSFSIKIILHTKMNWGIFSLFMKSNSFFLIVISFNKYLIELVFSYLLGRVRFFSKLKKKSI